MADVTYTPTSVVLASGPAPIPVQIGATAVTAGMPLYFDSATQRYLPANNNTQAAAAVSCIALSAASPGQWTMAALPGSVITYASGLTKGTAYFVSTNNGGIAPFADLTSTKWITQVGIALSTTQLIFAPNVTGTQV